MSKGTKLLAELEVILKRINEYQLKTETSVSDFNDIIDDVSESLSLCDEEATKIAEAEAEAVEAARVAMEAAEVQAEVDFVAELNRLNFVSDASGRIGCLMTSDTDVDASTEVEAIMSTLSPVFPPHLKPENFNGVFSTLTKEKKNYFFFTLFLNLKKSKVVPRTKLHLEKFAGKDGIKYYLSNA